MSIDPQTLLAQATSAAGNIIATFVLNKQGAAAIPTLQNLASQLPQIPVGKITPNQAGVLAAQIQGVASLTTATDTLVASNLGSLAALVTNSAASATSGDVTVTQALLVGAAQNFATGINNAIQFYQGYESVVSPPAKTS
jgi:hypothetical protein